MLGAVLMTTSAFAMAQSPTGGTPAGVGAGMTKSQSNSDTLGNPKAMGNGPGVATSPTPAPMIASPSPAGGTCSERTAAKASLPP